MTCYCGSMAENKSGVIPVLSFYFFTISSGYPYSWPCSDLVPPWLHKRFCESGVCALGTAMRSFLISPIFYPAKLCSCWEVPQETESLPIGKVTGIQKFWPFDLLSVDHNGFKIHLSLPNNTVMENYSSLARFFCCWIRINCFTRPGWTSFWACMSAILS